MGISKKIRFILRKLNHQKIVTSVYSNEKVLPPAEANLVIKNTLNSHSGFQTIDKKLSKNRIAFYIKDNDELAHVSFLHKKNLLAWQLGYTDTYIIGDCITYDKFKGKGYYGHTVVSIIELFHPIKCILFIEPSNTASIKGVEKIGLVKIGEYTVYRFMGIAYKIVKHD